jgi:hypothetical protein
MSRSDIPVIYSIRYSIVAGLQQLPHLCCPDTTPRAGCLYDCPTCVIVTATTYALVTFHTERVCTVQCVLGTRLTSLTRDNYVRRAAIANSPAEGKFT